MKLRNLLLSFIFLLITAFTCIYTIIIKEPLYLLLMEARTANNFIVPNFSNIKNGIFQETFEEAFADQFPKRQVMLQSYNYINHQLYSLSLPNKKDMTLVSIGDNVYDYKISDGYLTSFPIIKTKLFEEGIPEFTNNVNEIAKKYENINFYVYKPFRLFEASWFDSDNGFISKGTYYSQMFFNSFDEPIIAGTNEMSSLDEYKRLYYKTDPHWNCYGSYEGYKDIVDMFNLNYGDLEYINYNGEITFDSHKYYGSLGKASTYLTEPDVFKTFDYILKPYKTYSHGNEIQYDKRQEFADGNASDYSWSFIYSEYNGNDIDEVEFVTENNTGRNLLCFVDSYSSPIKHIIAQHFDTAWYIDPRINQSFNFREFMIEHPEITDVLYLGFAGSLYSTPEYVFEDF